MLILYNYFIKYKMNKCLDNLPSKKYYFKESLEDDGRKIISIVDDFNSVLCWNYYNRKSDCECEDDCECEADGKYCIDLISSEGEDDYPYSKTVGVFYRLFHKY